VRGSDQISDPESRIIRTCVTQSYSWKRLATSHCTNKLKSTVLKWAVYGRSGEVVDRPQAGDLTGQLTLRMKAREGRLSFVFHYLCLVLSGQGLQRASMEGGY
jgi:hypothetical protein